jgi:rod shape-determining protein MreD
MTLDLPVMLMLLGSAAALQTALPPIPGSLLKFPLLAAVAFYYASNRPIWVTLVVALWAGILTDGLGGVPPGTSAIVLALIALVLAGLRNVVPEASWSSAAVLGAVGMPVLALAQVLTLRRQGSDLPFAWPLYASLLLLIPVGSVLAGCLWSVGRQLDLWAGNTEPRKEIENRAG